MSYIETPLDVLLEQYKPETELSISQVEERYDSFTESAVPITEGMLSDETFILPSEPNGPRYYEDGITEDLFVKMYLPLLTKEYDEMLQRADGILSDSKYDEIKKAVKFEPTDRVAATLKGIVLNLYGRVRKSDNCVAIPFMSLNLYSMVFNPHCVVTDKDKHSMEIARSLGRSLEADLNSAFSDASLFKIGYYSFSTEITFDIIMKKPINFPVIHSVTESHLVIKPNKVKVGDPGFFLDDTYYSIRWLDKKPYRDRVETLVIKDGDKLFVRLLDDNNNEFPYTVPGGGLDLDSSPIQQAENETNEEALLKLKNVSATGVTFVTHYKNDSKSKFRKIKNFPIKYAGSFTEVFVAEYDGPFTGHIEEKDLDPRMANEGLFMPISDLRSMLFDRHVQALINSGMIKEEVKVMLMIQDMVCESFKVPKWFYKLSNFTLNRPTNVLVQYLTAVHKFKSESKKAKTKDEIDECIRVVDKALAGFKRVRTHKVRHGNMIPIADKAAKEAIIDKAINSLEKTKQELELKTPVSEGTLERDLQIIHSNNMKAEELYCNKVDELFNTIPSNNDDLESNIYNHKVRFIELSKFVQDSMKDKDSNSHLKYLFTLHLNKQISSVRFTCKSIHDKEQKKLWNEFDQWLVDLKKTLIVSINEMETTVESTHSLMTLNKMYFLSEHNQDHKVLTPTPDENMTRTYRTKFYPTVECALELSLENVGKKFYVHEPIKEQTNTTFVENEIWVTNPVKVKCVGSVIVNESQGVIQLQYDNNDLEQSSNHNKILSESIDMAIVMEADPLDDEESTDYTDAEDADDVEAEEIEPTDYTDTEDEDSEEQDGKDTGYLEDDVDVEEEPTDYTEDETDSESPEGDIDDDIEGDPTDTDDTTEKPTDYTEDDPDSEPADTDNNGDEEETTTDEEPTEDEGTEETDDGSIKVKNKYLLKDFNRLFLTVDQIIGDLETTVYVNPIQNSGIAQVLKNLNKIKDFVLSYVRDHFNLTSYTSNLYYYNIAMQSLKLNYKMLEKIQELGSNNKQIDKK